jgi:Pyruvate/2-oxoacid:ferredoxin oxidoreductase delta subunit
MKFQFPNKNNLKTKFILLDSKICKACWMCIETCPNGVINKVDFFFHKHSKIIKAENCKGCQKCIKICESKAISLIILEK